MLLAAFARRRFALVARQIGGRQFQGAGVAAQRRPHHREEAPAVGQVAHRPYGARIEFGTLVERAEVKLEKPLDRLADQHLAARAAQLQQRALVDRKDVAGTVDGDQRLVQQPDEFGPAVKAQDPGLLILVQEIPARDQVRRHVDQSHRVALDQPAVARLDCRRIERSHDHAVRVENGRRGTRQGQVIAAKMFLAMHRDGAALDEAGADAVSALVPLVPQCAERQAGLAEFTLQRRIGDRAEHRTLGIRQDDREARSGNLLVQALHLGARHRQQFAHALLLFLEGQRIQHGNLPRCLGYDAVLPHTALPGSRDVWLYARRMKSALHDAKDSRRVTGRETFVRHNPPYRPSSRQALELHITDAGRLRATLPIPCKAWSI